MSEKVVKVEGENVGEEMKRRLLAISAQIEIMGVQSGKLAQVAHLLPDSVMKHVEDAIRPFTAAVRKMQEECQGFVDYSKRFDEIVAARQRAANYDAFFEKPSVAKLVN